MKNFLWAVALLTLSGTVANAALVSRQSGQAYYDTVQDLTWLADANYSATSGFDADGLMIPSAAAAWIVTLNVANHLGVSDWRLPVTVQPDLNCSSQFLNGDGFGTNCSLSELPYLYIGYGVWSSVPSPFTNVRPGCYWTGTPYSGAPATTWVWCADSVQQLTTLDVNSAYSWAVRDGDIAALPVPAAVWLFSGALGALGWLRRRQATS